MKRKTREEFLHELGDLEFPVGSYVLLWGGSFVSLIITLIQRLLFGEKRPPTHIQRAYDMELDISAEWRGVRSVVRKKRLKNAKRVIIASHAQLSGNEEKFKRLSNQYLNTGYDFYFYFIWAMRVMLIFSPFILAWTFLINKIAVSILVGIFILIYWPFKNYLQHKSKRSWACAELSNEIDVKLGIDTGIDENIYTSPLHYLRMMRIAKNEMPVIYDTGWIK